MGDIIRERDWWFGNLTYAGKAMGLSSYGKRDDELFSYVTQLYDRSKVMKLIKLTIIGERYFVGVIKKMKSQKT